MSLTKFLKHEDELQARLQREKPVSEKRPPSAYSRETYYGTRESNAALETLKRRYALSSNSDVIRLLLIAAAEGNVALMPGKAAKTGRRK